MLKNMMNRAKHVVKGEDGASNIEIIVWIAVVLVIATALFAFRDQIAGLLGSATSDVGNMDDTIKAQGNR